MPPNPNTAEMMLRYFGLWWSGTMSVMTMVLMVYSPPPPMPWTVRPTSSKVKLLARQQMRLPAVNMTTQKRRTVRRPRISLVAPMNGRNVALERRKEAPTQNVSTAEPFKSAARVYRRQD
jgi:hypothetical protein